MKHIYSSVTMTKKRIQQLKLSKHILCVILGLLTSLLVLDVIVLNMVIFFYFFNICFYYFLIIDILLISFWTMYCHISYFRNTKFQTNQMMRKVCTGPFLGILFCNNGFVAWIQQTAIICRHICLPQKF